jgi:hypothetical protein
MMDGQGVEAALVLPTLGVCVEHQLRDDIPAAVANLPARSSLARVAVPTQCGEDSPYSIPPPFAHYAR